MSTLGFEEYVEPLRVYLQKYREVRPARLRRCPVLAYAYAAPLAPAPPLCACRLRCGLLCVVRRERPCASADCRFLQQGEKASAAKAGDAKKDAMHFSLGFQQ